MLFMDLILLLLPNPQEFVHKEGVTKVEFVKKMHERIKEQIQQKLRNIQNITIRGRER